MQKNSKRLLVATLCIVGLLMLCFQFYLYAISQQIGRKVIKLEQQLKLQTHYTDILDFTYNFMSRLTSRALFSDPNYSQKHMTTNVFDVLKQNIDWAKKILHYDILGVTISGDGQSILKVDLSVVNKAGHQQTARIYLYIEGEKGRFIITHLKAYDVNNQAIHTEG